MQGKECYLRTEWAFETSKLMSKHSTRMNPVCLNTKYSYLGLVTQACHPSYLETEAELSPVQGLQGLQNDQPGQLSEILSENNKSKKISRDTVQCDKVPKDLGYSSSRKNVKLLKLTPHVFRSRLVILSH